MTEQEAEAWVCGLPGVGAKVLDKLRRLATELVAENQLQNLVASATLASVWTRHIADSAQLLLHVPRETRRWIDLGSGAGFPGLVIACLSPETRIVLVESRARRIHWLQRMIVELDLTNATVAGIRLESVETCHFDVISARAFAPLDRLLDLAARFSTVDTRWVLPKGRTARQELAALTGWAHTFHVEQSVTEPEAGVIVGTLIGRKGRSL